MKKRLLALIALSLCAVLVLSACSNGGGQDQPSASSSGSGSGGEKIGEGRTLVVGVWGAEQEQLVREHVVKPFEEETGATVELILGGTADRYSKLYAEVDNPSMDVVYLNMAQTEQASRDGVVLPADPEGVANYNNLYDIAKVGDGKCIAFTIDEAQAASLEDMTALATALQHVIRDEDMRDVPDSRKKGVALVFAALPSLMDELLNDRVLAFLRRSMQRELAEVSLPDVRSAYVETVRESGKAISEEDALAAARAACGYPYMIQLIGYYMWQAAERRGSCVIESADVETGISDAVLAFGDAVCAPLLDGLTPAQRAFVQAMAADDPEPSRLSDIAERTRRSMSWANKYRASLIKERVVEPEGRGLLRLTTPHLAEYIRARRRS